MHFDHCSPADSTHTLPLYNFVAYVGSMSVGLWLGTSPVHSLVFFLHRDIFCYFGSFLVDTGHFQ